MAVGLAHPALLSAEAAELCTALLDGAASLTQRVTAEGRFRYRLDGDGLALKGYNVVRHAGTLWALEQLHREHPEAVARGPLERASRGLMDCCLAPLPKWPFEAIWSVPEGEPDEAKLGAAGLALAAWSGLSAQGLQAPPPERLRALARFIVYLQKPDGRFHSKFQTGARRDRWVSLYYPGEAALGLLTYAAIDADPLWEASARRALHVLAAPRVASGSAPPDHWAVIATAALPLPEPLLLAQVRLILTGMLAEQRADGHFGPSGRSAPTATRLEAIAAGRRLLPMDDPLQPRLRAAFDAGVAALLPRVRSEAPWQGAVIRGGNAPSEARFHELRIDDTQHALSVWQAAVAIAAPQKNTCTRP